MRSRTLSLSTSILGVVLCLLSSAAATPGTAHAFQSAAPSPCDCIPGGAGGAIPDFGATLDAWPGELPTHPLISTLAVTVPPGATRISAVKLNQLHHTWASDCHIVLTTPNGISVNLYQAHDGFTFGTCGVDFVGDYTFVDARASSAPCGGVLGDLECLSTDYPPGTYRQHFGEWPDLQHGFRNAELSTLPVVSGVWRIHIYDWFSGSDSGTLGSWELCFDTGPQSYCTAGTSSNGCEATMHADAQPSASLSTPCVIEARTMDGQRNGLIFYGVNNTGFVPTAWAPNSSSLMCVKSPTQRTGTLCSDGTLGACDGTLRLDWNAFQAASPTALGSPWSVGDKVYAQAWFRDPAAVKSTNLSNALELTLVP